jgi:hypothetical protein
MELAKDFVIVCKVDDLFLKVFLFLVAVRV